MKLMTKMTQKIEKRNWKYYMGFALNEKQYSITESRQRLFKEIYFERGSPGGSVVKKLPAMEEMHFPDPWVRKIP